MKKLLSTLLSIVLILAMCNTAFAATPQSSTTEVQASREYLAELYDIPTDVVNTLSPNIISGSLTLLFNIPLQKSFI